MISELSGLNKIKNLNLFQEALGLDDQKVNKETVLALPKVQEGDQNLILEPAMKQSKEEQFTTTLSDQAIKELGLKESPEMKVLVEQFVDTQLPLIREQLLQVYYLAKNYHLPLEVLTNFASKQEIPREKEFQLLSALKQDYLMNIGRIVGDLLELMNLQQQTTLAKALTKSLFPDEVKKALIEVLKPLLDAADVNNKFNVEIKNEGYTSFKENGKWQQGVKMLEEMFLERSFNKDKCLEYVPVDKLKELNRLLIEKKITIDLSFLKERAPEEIEKQQKHQSN